METVPFAITDRFVPVIKADGARQLVPASEFQTLKAAGWVMDTSRASVSCRGPQADFTEMQTTDGVIVRVPNGDVSAATSAGFVAAGG